LLVRQKKNQIRLSLCSHTHESRTKSALAVNCNRVEPFASPFPRESVSVRVGILRLRGCVKVERVVFNALNMHLRDLIFAPSAIDLASS
jgi:hypothetical protein